MRRRPARSRRPGPAGTPRPAAAAGGARHGRHASSLAPRVRFAAAFGALFLAVAGVGLTNAHQMRAVSAGTAAIEADWMPSIQALEELKPLFTRARLIGSRMLATAHPAEREAVGRRRADFHRRAAEAGARHEAVAKDAGERVASRFEMRRAVRA